MSNVARLRSGSRGAFILILVVLFFHANVWAGPVEKRGPRCHLLTAITAVAVLALPMALIDTPRRWVREGTQREMGKAMGGLELSTLDSLGDDKDKALAILKRYSYLRRMVVENPHVVGSDIRVGLEHFPGLSTDAQRLRVMPSEDGKRLRELIGRFDDDGAGTWVDVGYLWTQGDVVGGSTCLAPNDADEFRALVYWEIRELYSAAHLDLKTLNLSDLDTTRAKLRLDWFGRLSAFVPAGKR